MNTAKHRASTSAEYIRRINKTLAFIDCHVDQTIRLEDLAKVSHFSAFHFHRIYHAMVGETMNEYVTRKRMEKAVYRLVRKPALSITEVATSGGFSSSANFSKAFKLYFGISPSELRNAGSPDTMSVIDSKIGKIYRKYGKAFNPRDLYSLVLTNAAVIEPDNLKEILMQSRLKLSQKKPLCV